MELGTGSWVLSAHKQVQMQTRQYPPWDSTCSGWGWRQPMDFRAEWSGQCVMCSGGPAMFLWDVILSVNEVQEHWHILCMPGVQWCLSWGSLIHRAYDLHVWGGRHENWVTGDTKTAINVYMPLIHQTMWKQLIYWGTSFNNLLIDGDFSWTAIVYFVDRCLRAVAWYFRGWSSC